MQQIDQILVKLLSISLPQLQLAVSAKDWTWAREEIEFSHNIPTLIGREVGDRDTSPHGYFWDVTIPAFLSWTDTLSEDRIHVVKAMYKPVIDELSFEYAKHWNDQSCTDKD